MDHIPFEEALKIIESGDVVSLKYVTYDHKRKTGGEIRILEQGMITTPKRNRVKTNTNASSTKAQNHYKSFTRNFFVCIDGERTASIKKIHLNFILELNGKKVML